MKIKLIPATIAACLLACIAPAGEPIPVMYVTNMSPGGKPYKNYAGKYSALEYSMSAGSTSIRPEQITAIGQPVVQLWEGKVYWAVPVTWTERTHIGGWHVREARAMMRDGHVDRWLYTAPKQGTIPRGSIYTPSSMDVR